MAGVTQSMAGVTQSQSMAGVTQSMAGVTQSQSMAGVTQSQTMAIDCDWLTTFVYCVFVCCKENSALYVTENTTGLLKSALSHTKNDTK